MKDLDTPPYLTLRTPSRVALDRKFTHGLNTSRTVLSSRPLYSFHESIASFLSNFLLVQFPSCPISGLLPPCPISGLLKTSPRCESASTTFRKSCIPQRVCGLPQVMHTSASLFAPVAMIAMPLSGELGRTSIGELASALVVGVIGRRGGETAGGETGRGAIGCENFSRSVLGAGSSAAVLSLWPTEDAYSKSLNSSSI